MESNLRRNETFLLTRTVDFLKLIDFKEFDKEPDTYAVSSKGSSTILSLNKPSSTDVGIMTHLVGMMLVSPGNGLHPLTVRYTRIPDNCPIMNELA